MSPYPKSTLMITWTGAFSIELFEKRGDMVPEVIIICFWIPAYANEIMRLPFFVIPADATIADNDAD